MTLSTYVVWAIKRGSAQWVATFGELVNAKGYTFATSSWPEHALVITKETSGYRLENATASYLENIVWDEREYEEEEG